MLPKWQNFANSGHTGPRYCEVKVTINSFGDVLNDAVNSNEVFKTNFVLTTFRVPL